MDILMMELKTTELQKQVTLLIAGKGRFRKKLRIGFWRRCVRNFWIKITEIDMDADEDEIIQQILNSKLLLKVRKLSQLMKLVFRVRQLVLQAFFYSMHYLRQK